MILHQVYTDPESMDKNRTWRFDDPATAVAEYQELLQEYLLLIITPKFFEDTPEEDQELLIKDANDVCLQTDAHSRQRVLLLDQEEVVEQLASGLNAAIEQEFPEDSLETLPAFTVLPQSGKVAGLVRTFHSIFIRIAFGQAIRELPNLNLPTDFPAT